LLGVMAHMRRYEREFAGLAGYHGGGDLSL
jgi:hypothetical protein